MGKSEEYVSRTEEFLEKLSKEIDFEVVDVEFVKEGSQYYLRAYCDKESGISMDDCVEISHALSSWLDLNDFIQESYTLEVSSPGLGRKLKKDKDFIREKGKKVDIRLYTAVNGEKEFTGILEDFDKENIYIEVDSDAPVKKKSSKSASKCQGNGSCDSEAGILKIKRTDIAVIKLNVGF